jgi:hypothetical protein
MRGTCKLVLIGLLALTACGGGRPDAADSTEPAEASEAPRDDRPSEYADAPSHDGKKGSGWRWKGRRQDCFFVANNECFEVRIDACRAAGCGKERCRDKSGTAPVQVRCAEED